MGEEDREQFSRVNSLLLSGGCWGGRQVIRLGSKYLSSLSWFASGFFLKKKNHEEARYSGTCLWSWLLRKKRQGDHAAQDSGASLGNTMRHCSQRQNSNQKQKQMTIPEEMEYERMTTQL